MLADPEPFGNFRHPAASLGYMGHRIALNLVTGISLALRRLLSSKLRKKASTNLGAIQSKRLVFRKPGCEDRADYSEF